MTKHKTEKGAVANEFTLAEGESMVRKVQGVDAYGRTVDIEAVATLVVKSSDKKSVCVRQDSPMSYTVTGVKWTDGVRVTVEVEATWNDGSVGPFSYKESYEVTSGAVVGLVVHSD